MKKCPFCAEEIQDEAVKCRFCGENLNPGSPQKARPNPKAQIKKPSLISLIFSGIMAFVFIKCALSISDDEKTPKAKSPETSSLNSSQENLTEAGELSVDPLPQNEAHSGIRELPVNERNFYFGHFLKKSGEACDQAIRTFYQGAGEDHTAFWNVECRDKNSYSISIASDKVGSSRITDCKMMKLLNKGEDMCFKKFPKE